MSETRCSGGPGERSKSAREGICDSIRICSIHNACISYKCKSSYSDYLFLLTDFYFLFLNKINEDTKLYNVSKIKAHKERHTAVRMGNVGLDYGLEHWEHNGAAWDLGTYKER